VCFATYGVLDVLLCAGWSAGCFVVRRMVNYISTKLFEQHENVVHSRCEGVISLPAVVNSRERFVGLL
jgi:hypothetical protein